MFEFSKEQLNYIKAFNTVTEIKNQGELWQESYNKYEKFKNEINEFLQKLNDKYKKIRVIFTGAGTSSYVGNIIIPYLLNLQDDRFSFESIATTDIVSNPKQYLQNIPTLLVSFARSGNSPESLQAVNLANKLIDDVNHLAITCAKDGKLALNLKNKDNAYVMLMPELSNDKAFAMTSSFSCMLLTSLLIFDKTKNDYEKLNIVKTISDMASDAISRQDEIKKYINLDFDRIVYLGSGVLSELTREAQLKILELTAGKITTCYDSSMGFRHGPKSFVNEKTLVFDFVSTDDYTRKYDIDIINEIFADKIAKNVVAITNDTLESEFEQFSFKRNEKLEDIYLVFPYTVVAQMISVMSSVKVGNTPDTPSATGTVNRVVKGVIIHNLD